MREAVEACGVKADILEVKTGTALSRVDALVFPGGESTTMGKLLRTFKLEEEIKRLVRDGVPVLGTCAGLVLLAKEGDYQVEKTRQPLLGLVDMKVSRNAFGRQRESFEVDLHIPLLGSKPYHGVFIRAPAIERVWGKAKPLCEFEGRVVAAREENILVTAFHPELSGDLRLHGFFLGLL
jgi:5'-phosphate synthase pdxT subunit